MRAPTFLLLALLLVAVAAAAPPPTPEIIPGSSLEWRGTDAVDYCRAIVNDTPQPDWPRAEWTPISGCPLDVWLHVGRYDRMPRHLATWRPSRT